MPPLTLQLRQTAAALIPSLQATIILPWIVTTTSTQWNSQRTLWRMTREIRSDSRSSPLLYLRPRCKQNHQCPQQDTWWRATRLCFEPPTFQLRSRNGNGMLACFCWWFGVGFRRWWTGSVGFQVCRWHINFWNKLPGRRYIVGQTCGKFGGSGPSVECRKNKNFDITSPATGKIANTQRIDHIYCWPGIKP